MRRKMLCIGLVCCLGMSLLAGCESKKVDYGIDKNAEGTASGSKTGVEQFRDAKDWTETLQASKSNGDTIDLNIDAKVSVPGAERMHVIEVEEPVFDEEYKRGIAERIFGEETVYYNDYTHLPAKELAERMEDYQFEYHNYENNEDSDNEEVREEATRLADEYRALLAECEELMETAKDTYTPVEEYTVNEYLGERDGTSYELTFIEAERRGDFWYNPGGGYIKEIHLEPVDDDQGVVPEEVAKSIGEGNTTWFHAGILPGGKYQAENQCGMSEEEAMEEARQFVDSLGLEYEVLVYSYPLLWSAFEQEDICNGYVFGFDFGIDNIAFVDFGSDVDYLNYSYQGDRKKESEERYYAIEASIEVFVTDRGVIQMSARNPIKTIGITENVALLPLDAVKNTMKEAMLDNIGQFRFLGSTWSGKEFEFDSMELIYFRVRNREKERNYSYVPVWRLSEKLPRTLVDDRNNSIQNPVLVNAIDGSLVSLYEEL